MIDFRLKVFCCVARQLSFTKAAKQLGITQPAISNHIQELEQEYATRLFERHSNHIELTVAGETLLSHAEAILERYDALNFDMQLHAHGLSGTLRLGATTTIARHLLPEHVASFATKFKHIKLSLIEGNTHDITQALEQGRIDIGLVEGGDRHPQLRYTPIMHDELVLVAPTSGCWAAVETISVEGLQNIPLVMAATGTDAAILVEQSFAKEGIDLSQFNILLQPADDESVLRYAQLANCMALVSLQAVKQELKAAKFRVVNIDCPVRIEREFAFVRNLSQTNDLTKDFITYLQEMIG